MPKNFTSVEHLYLPDETSAASAAEDMLPCSTQHELKIWFTKPSSDDPLGGIHNEIRLLNAIKRYPEHHFRLIYEPKNLSHIGQARLNKFCEQQGIELFSLDNIEDELQRCLKDGSLDASSATTQLALLEMARKESQSEWGNLAAASDIVRTLTPALRVSSQDEEGLLQTVGTRIYTDFDESLAVGLPDILLLKKGELLKVKDNNNCLFPQDSESNTLKKVREIIFNQYQEENIDSLVSNVVEKSFFDANRRHKSPGLWVMQPLMEGETQALLLRGVLEEKLNEMRDDYLASGGGVLPSTISREPYQITDIYAFRRAIVEFQHLSQLDKFEQYKCFFDEAYFNLVIYASGPGVYDKEHFVIGGDEIPLLQSKHFSGESDLSWADTSHYHATVANQNKAAEKISEKLGQLFKEKKQLAQSLQQGAAEASSEDTPSNPKKPPHK